MTNKTADETLMWTPGEVAERDGTSTQRVTSWVRRFAAAGQLEIQRDNKGRIAKFNIAQFDQLYERCWDLTRIRRGNKARVDKLADAAGSDTEYAAVHDGSLTEARRRVTWLDVERRRLDLAQRKGELLTTESVVAATNEAGAVVVESIDGLDRNAEGLNEAAQRDGENGVRTLLRKIAHDLRTKLADTFDTMAAEMENPGRRGESDG